jgi:hypothetical protein
MEKHGPLVVPPQWVKELHPKFEDKMKLHKIDSYTRIAVDYNDSLARECYAVILNGVQLLCWAVYYHASDSNGLLSYQVKISIHL